MGHIPQVPWSMPDQDEPETWASWAKRHQRPPVHFQEEERKPEPEAGVAAFCILAFVAVGAFFWACRFFGVL